MDLLLHLVLEEFLDGTELSCDVVLGNILNESEVLVCSVSNLAPVLPSSKTDPSVWMWPSSSYRLVISSRTLLAGRWGLSSLAHPDSWPCLSGGSRSQRVSLYNVAVNSYFTDRLLFFCNSPLPPHPHPAPSQKERSVTNLATFMFHTMVAEATLT